MEGHTLPRVLIVEDDETVRGFLIRALEGEGCEPVGVPDGETALRAVADDEVAVTLIDGILPDMHGFRLAERIIEEPAGASVGICFVTGAVRDTTAFTAGVGALCKPVRLRELRTAVADLMRWRSDGGSPLEARRSALRNMEQLFLVGP